MLNAMRKPAVSATESVTQARRIADISSARLWLAEGLPIADILTMLEVRRRFEFSPDDCRVYAIEILSTARTAHDNTVHLEITHHKETRHAVA
jgi:hypothetical protein